MPLELIWVDGSWSHMFDLQLSVVEKIIRPILVYIFLVLLLRLFGKRELAQLNPFDLVVLLSLSNTVQNAIIGDDLSVTGGLVGAFSLCAINYAVVRFLFKHRRLDQLLEGKPTTLIKQGQIVRRNLARELITRAELTTIAHRQGFASVDEIESCTLEPGGTFAIEGKTPGLQERMHLELIEKLALLQAKLEAIEKQLAAQPKSSETGLP
jgi:uncharacterized membrane protein YcaP (DUF421 family)